MTKLIPGSTLYYSLLYSSENVKENIFLMFSFYYEILSILDKCSNNDIALQRLQWWRGEIHRLYLGSAEHPASIAISPIIKKHLIPKEIMLGLIDGVETRLYTTHYPNIKALIEAAHSSWSLLAIALCYILEDTTKESLLLARELGVIWQIAYNIKRMPLDFSKHRYYLPEDALKLSGIQIEELNGSLSNPKISNKLFLFFRDFITDTKKQLSDTLEKNSFELKNRQLALVIYSSLNLETISLLSKKPLTKKSFPLHLTPIKKWWVALSTKRKMKT